MHHITTESWIWSTSAKSARNPWISKLSPPALGWPHVTTDLSARMAANAPPFAGWICSTCLSSSLTAELSPPWSGEPHVTTDLFSRMVAKAPSVEWTFFTFSRNRAEMCSRHRIVDCPTWPQIHLLGLQQMQKPWLGRTLCRQRCGLECHRHNVQSPMSCDDPVASMAPQCKSSVHRSELWANDCTDVITVSNPHTLQRLLWILQDASLCSDKPEFTAGSFRKRPPRLFFSNAPRSRTQVLQEPPFCHLARSCSPATFPE